jgi:hypothetical protein
MIRPGAAATLGRWREVLAGAALALGGLWLLPGPGWVLPGLGLALAALGAGLVVVGLRRVRLGRAAEGPGVVQVVEGQVAYFGPDGGGFVALDDLVALAADGPDWVLTGADGTRLRVPRGARGVEALTDALLRLPGLDPARLVAAAAPGAAGSRVWHRGARGAPRALPLTRPDGRDRSGAP